MFSILSSYRPDPFRFRPPQLRLWAFPWFYLLNQWLLRKVFGFTGVHLTPEDLRRLQIVRQYPCSLVMINHVNFTDPHVFSDLVFRGRFLPLWMAGIEPFDKGRGVFGWHLQSFGVFSVDRGVLDRPAIEMAQRVLDDGQHPLVIYPEGEACYTNGVLQPFYTGAALFALNTHQKFPQRPMRLVPVGVRYRFVSPGVGQQQVLAGFQRFAQQLNAASAQWPALRIDPTSDPWAQLNALLHRAVMHLEAQQHLSSEASRPLIERLQCLEQHLLSALLAEHLPQMRAENLSTSDLMDLKNRLRSIIVRKRHAPTVEALQAALSQFQQPVGPQHIARMEKQWIGIDAPQLPLEKRVKQLQRHLKQQLPYAEGLVQATPQDLTRWDQQENQTRQIKMLRLLQADVQRHDTTWDALDETLVKLEIMMLSQFNYRGPKNVTVRVGEPLDLAVWCEANAHTDKKQQQTQLTDAMRTQITQLIESD